MDFKKTIIEKKWFKLGDYTGNKKDKEEFEFINPNTHADFLDERARILKDKKTESERQKALTPLVAKHLINNFKNVFYGKKEVKFTKKNCLMILSSFEFKVFAYERIFNLENFRDDIGLDLELIAKN